MTRMIRSVAVTVVAIGVLASASVASAASSYCSKSGDVCYGAKERNGNVRISFGTFSFQGRVKVCVTSSVQTNCKAFRLREQETDFYGFNVGWSAHFPDNGAGTYRVRFRKFGNVLGPAVTFRQGS